LPLHFLLKLQFYDDEFWNQVFYHLMRKVNWNIDCYHLVTKTTDILEFHTYCFFHEINLKKTDT
jgi:hypothetical protein